ncbi:hypothetical protein D3C71_2092290 [compost metagenome]
MKNQPGTKPAPARNTAVKASYEISELSDLSSIHTMNGSSANMITPLMRCRIETHAAAGMR